MIDPRTKPEIRRELRALHERSTVFWAAFSTADFVAPIGEAWSPADNVRHLIKSIRPLAGGLRVPRLLVLHNLHHVQNVARRKGIVFEERT